MLLELGIGTRNLHLFTCCLPSSPVSSSFSTVIFVTESVRIKEDTCVNNKRMNHTTESTFYLLCLSSPFSLSNVLWPDESSGELGVHFAFEYVAPLLQLKPQASAQMDAFPPMP